MLLSELLLGSGVECPAVCRGLEVTGVCEDSRAVSAGDVYVAIRGTRQDGHSTVGEAISRGARAVILNEGCGISPLSLSVPCLFVADTRRILPFLYASLSGHPEKRLTFIGVTGTNGKTTVASIIYSSLNASGKNCGMIGTLGAFLPSGARVGIRSSDPFANMTTPAPRELFAILHELAANGAEYVVMEVSSHALSQHRVEPLYFDVAVFTNLSAEHLDYHKDMDEYFSEKKKLFLRAARAVICIDDRYGRMLAGELNIPYVTTATQGKLGADLSIASPRVTLDSVEYRVVSRSLRLRVRMGIGGMFALPNSLQAVAVLSLLGLSGAQIRSALAQLRGVSGRLERVPLPRGIGFSVYIDYAHTPDALESLLRTVLLCRKRGERVVLLFGCGGERDRYKRRQMGRIGSKMSDLLIVTSDNSRGEDKNEIIGEILSGVDKESQFLAIPDRKSAIEYAITFAQRGDIILLCGKGHEEYEIDSEGRKPFSEKEIVKNAVEMRARQEGEK